MGRIEWEDAVYSCLCIRADVSRGDAQAIAEGQESVLETAWMLRAEPRDAAAAILHKAQRVQS